jgi:hypothetical protein
MKPPAVGSPQCLHAVVVVPPWLAWVMNATLIAVPPGKSMPGRGADDVTLVDVIKKSSTWYRAPATGVKLIPVG